MSLMVIIIAALVICLILKTGYYDTLAMIAAGDPSTLNDLELIRLQRKQMEEMAEFKKSQKEM